MFSSSRDPVITSTAITARVTALTTPAEPSGSRRHGPASAIAAMTPAHTRKRGKLYRYYVSSDLIRTGSSPSPIRRVPSAQIEDSVVAQIRAVVQTPEIIVATWRTAKRKITALTERQVREQLLRFDDLWSELFPAERVSRQKKQVRLGLRYVRNTPELLVPLLMIAVVGTLAWEFQVTLPLIASRVFGGDAATYGVMADRKSTRLNSSHIQKSRMPSSA